MLFINLFNEAKMSTTASNQNMACVPATARNRKRRGRPRRRADTMLPPAFREPGVNEALINVGRQTTLHPSVRQALPPAAPDPVRLAWVAGFIDGEGCIHISKQQRPGWLNPTYRLTLTITQNHLGVLERVRDVLGLQHHIHAVPQRMQHNKQMHTLVYDGVHALRAIAMVSRYLVRKRKEARVALSYRRRGWMSCLPGPNGFPKRVWQWREHCRTKLQALK
jgi:hypothetical protein